MEIIPNHGVGDIHFGMRPSQIKEIMGSELTWEEWMGGNLNDAIYYSGLVLIFDKCDTRGPLENASLTEIWINKNNKKITFQGMYIYNLTRYQFERNLKTRNLSYITRDSDNELYVKDLNLEIAFEKDGTVYQLWLFGSFD